MSNNYSNLQTFNFGKRIYAVMKNNDSIVYFEVVNGNYSRDIISFNLYDNEGKSLTLVNQHFFMSELVNRINVACKKGFLVTDKEIIDFLTGVKKASENDVKLKQIFKGSLMSEINEENFESNKRKITSYLDNFKFDDFSYYDNVSVFSGSIDKNNNVDLNNTNNVAFNNIDNSAVQGFDFSSHQFDNVDSNEISDNKNDIDSKEISDGTSNVDSNKNDISSIINNINNQINAKENLNAENIDTSKSLPKTSNENSNDYKQQYNSLDNSNDNSLDIFDDIQVVEDSFSKDNGDLSLVNDETKNGSVDNTSKLTDETNKKITNTGFNQSNINLDNSFVISQNSFNQMLNQYNNSNIKSASNENQTDNLQWVDSNFNNQVENVSVDEVINGNFNNQPEQYNYDKTQSVLYDRFSGQINANQAVNNTQIIEQPSINNQINTQSIAGNTNTVQQNNPISYIDQVKNRIQNNAQQLNNSINSFDNELGSDNNIDREYGKERIENTIIQDSSILPELDSINDKEENSITNKKEKKKKSNVGVFIFILVLIGILIAFGFYLYNVVF